MDAFAILRRNLPSRVSFATDRCGDEFALLPEARHDGACVDLLADEGRAFADEFGGDQGDGGDALADFPILELGQLDEDFPPRAGHQGS
jgi:hypothetical protein